MTSMAISKQVDKEIQIVEALKGGKDDPGIYGFNQRIEAIKGI